ncbi:hypothetical protein BGZ98_009233 [Dissophora globulifera]|nr:hypothetical protein BGZ98_009233 [Dissophora globulifera]
MIKNIGKFKQWTGEKMGRAHKTRMDEDFSMLQAETEAKRGTLEKLNDTSLAYLKVLNKRVEGDDKFKGLAIETFGTSMVTHSNVLREGSIYREALLQVGEAQQTIGAALGDLIDRFGSTYLECLERELLQMKEYYALQRKLQSRRLEYDAKLAKVHKAKREKPEWEQEMQSSKAKYEETRANVLAVMTAMQESQEYNVHSLKGYYDAQLAFARKMVEVLEAIPESTFVTLSPMGSCTSLHSAGYQLSRRPCGQSSDEDHLNYCSDDHSSLHSIPGRQQHGIDHAASSSDLRRQLAASHQLTPNASPTSALLLNRGQHRQVRALYNFEATGEGELSFHKGDVITVIEEIDEGWWEGEFVDSNGVRFEGMFPSNYVEEVITEEPDDFAQHHHQQQVQQLYQQEKRQSSLNSNISDPGHYADIEEEAYYSRPSQLADHNEDIDLEPAPKQETPLLMQTQLPTSSVAKQPVPPHIRHFQQALTSEAVSPTAAPAPPGTITPSVNGATLAHNSQSSARATPPPSRPSSSMAAPVYGKAVGSRAPPPPPTTAIRRGAGTDLLRHTAVLNSCSMMAGGSTSASTSPPSVSLISGAPVGRDVGYVPKESFVNQAPAAAAETEHVEATPGPCRDCQCTDFIPNMFKQGSCNNCFHTH